MYRTWHDDNRARYFAGAGSRDKTVYKPVIDDNGVLHLREDGKYNLYEEIQSYRDSVDLHLILERYANGDVTALSRAQGTYGDFTGFPTTYAGVLNLINDGRMYFDSLPLDVRNKFNNSFEQFFASMDRSDFWQLIGVNKPAASSSALSDERQQAASDAIASDGSVKE